MPPSHNDLTNEGRTRPLAHTIHALIDLHRATHHHQPFEWDLSLYYLTLSLAKSILKHHLRPAVHAPPHSKCIGIPYRISHAITRKTTTPTDAERLFRRLDTANWALDGYIYSSVGAYQRGDKIAVVNVVSQGAVIPRRVCPICTGGCHFSASRAAAVFGRLGVTGSSSASGDDSHTASASATGAGNTISSVTSPTGTPSLPGSAVTASIPGSASSGSMPWSAFSGSVPGSIPLSANSPGNPNIPPPVPRMYPAWPNAPGWGYQYLWYGYNHNHYPT